MASGPRSLRAGAVCIPPPPTIDGTALKWAVGEIAHTLHEMHGEEVPSV